MRRIAIALLGCLTFTAGAALSQPANAQPFPLDRELLLDVAPMRPSKRIPSVTVGTDGRVTFDLWCRSVGGKAELGEGTLALASDVLPAELSQQPLPSMLGPGQCSEARQQADEMLLADFVQVTGWAREGETIVLTAAGKTLRLRAASN